MKRILILLSFLLLPSLLFAETQLARMNPWVAGSTAASCPSYGVEKHTSSSADKPDDSDTGATTGWASQGLVQLIYPADADTTCGDGDDDCPAPQRGTYQIFMRSDSDGDRGYHDLSGYGLSASTVYKLSYYARHSGVAGTANWACIIFPANNGPASVGTYRQAFTTAENTYAQYTTYFLYSGYQDFFNCGENGATNDGGLYLDNFSITEATLCYGDEKYSATADALTGEADATTGWTGVNSGTVASVDDGDSACGVDGSSDCAAPHDGSFSLFVRSDQSTASSGAYFDLNTILTADKKYFIRFWASSDGTNAFNIGIGSSTSNLSTYNTSISSSTYTEVGYTFTHSASTRYLSVIEANAGNDGYLYIDGLSIKEIVDE